jgi:hypothetical protein
MKVASRWRDFMRATGVGEADIAILDRCMAFQAHIEKFAQQSE